MPTNILPLKLINVSIFQIRRVILPSTGDIGIRGQGLDLTSISVQLQDMLSLALRNTAGSTSPHLWRHSTRQAQLCSTQQTEGLKKGKVTKCPSLWVKGALGLSDPRGESLLFKTGFWGEDGDKVNGPPYVLFDG